MKIRILTVIIVILASMAISENLHAEAPCTAIGHESLVGLAVCLRQARASGNLDTHHSQVVNRLPAAMPHSYPMTPGLMPFIVIGGSNNSSYAYKNAHLVFPYSWGNYAYSPYRMMGY